MKRELIWRFLAALLVVAGMVLLNNVFAQAQGPTRGTWTGKWQANDQYVNLQMSLEQKESNYGQSYKVGDLKGLSAAAVTGPKTSVQFQIVRDAGTIAFDGFFDRGLGAGQFTFTPNANYEARMRGLGFSCITTGKQFEMAALDVSLAYATEFKDLGFGTECKDVVEGRIFNVNRQQVEELRALGYNSLPLKKLVELRIFKVDADYIRQMRAQGMDLSLDKLVESRIFEIKPEDRKAYADLGYTHLTQDELTAFKIHGVTPQYIREMRELGFKDLSPQKLEEFRIFGVGRAQIEDLKSVGYTGLAAQDLVNFKIHGVNSEFIRKVQKYGYKHPSPDKLVEMKILGIRVHDEDDDTL